MGTDPEVCGAGPGGTDLVRGPRGKEECEVGARRRGV